MTRPGIVACVVLIALAGCAPKPAPAPVRIVWLPAPPPPAAASPVNPVAALHADYAGAAARLHAYLAQPRCAPSGPIACADRAAATVANEAQRVAHDALGRADRAAAGARVAGLRVRAFQAVVDGLAAP